MTIIKYSTLAIMAIIANILLFSCTDAHSEADGHDHGAEQTETNPHTDTHSDEEHKDGEIHLTDAQIKAMNITYGDFSKIKINDYISATGTLGLPPNAYSSVSAKTSGFIKDSNKYVEGSYVKKGQRIAYIENPDLIQKQQEYLEITAELTYLNQELKRQQELIDANAGITKNLQKLQSQVKMKTATQKGKAKQLAYLGIDVSKLTPDNISQRVAITAPISGYITSINIHNGMYVEPQKELMVIVSENHLHLELDILENDIANVAKDQKITYTVPALGNQIYEGEVHVIGKEFNTQNKTVRVHGHLEKNKPRFIKDLYITAKIWLNDQTVEALPESAIIKDGTSSCIYVSKPTKAEAIFKKIRVIPGATSKGHTAVKLLDPIPEDMKIVTNGAYYVFAASKKGEGGHDH